MIPSDLAARLRLLLESVVQPLTPVSAVQRDLPAFERGQRFAAQVQSPLPDGTYRAIVAGRTVTLALPEPAKAGDSLELVVVDRTPRVIVATVALPSQEKPAAGTATLSGAAQLISRLLTGSSVAPPPTPLTRGQPLLETPPSQPAVLAAQLRRALIESGMFYESHQARWVKGELPLSALLAEPQGRESALLRLPADVVARLASAVTTGTPPGAAEGAIAEAENPLPPSPASPAAAAGSTASRSPVAPEVRLLAAILGANLPEAETAASASARAPGADAPPDAEATAVMPGRALPPALPKEVSNIVQHQLEALATHHLVWQGQIWPGQTATWEIEEPLRDREGGAAEEEATTWRTTLRMELPHLGSVTATLALESGGVTLVLAAPGEDAREEFRRGQPALEAALGAAGVPLLTMAVEHGAA